MADEIYWMRCATCGSHVRSDATVYRVCDGDPETGDRDCRLERIDRPVIEATDRGGAGG